MPASRTSRRGFTYSLRTLFVAVTLACIWLAWNVQWVRARQAALKSVREHGGGTSGWMRGNPGSAVPLPWIRRTLGDAPVDVIYQVSLSPEEQAKLERLFPEAVINPPLPTPR